MIRRVPATVFLAAAIVAGGAACKRSRPAAPTIDPHRLVIVNALWGALYEGLTADVTELVRGMVKKDALGVTATTSVLGDPAPGKVKYLRVVYQKGGILAKEIVGESGTLTVGYDEKPTPLRLVVTKAAYGDFVGGRTIDITLRLADMVKDDSLSVNNYNALFGDPASHTSKQLRIEYTVDGQARAKTLAETEPLVLSVPKPM
jgi:hypothetical protein